MKITMLCPACRCWHEPPACAIRHCRQTALEDDDGDQGEAREGADGLRAAVMEEVARSVVDHGCFPGGEPLYYWGRRVSVGYERSTERYVFAMFTPVTKAPDGFAYDYSTSVSMTKRELEQAGSPGEALLKALRAMGRDLKRHQGAREPG